MRVAGLEDGVPPGVRQSHVQVEAGKGSQSGTWDSMLMETFGTHGLLSVPCDRSAKDGVGCPVLPKNSSMMTASVPRELRQDWSQISRGVRSLEVPLRQCGEDPRTWEDRLPCGRGMCL